MPEPLVRLGGRWIDIGGIQYQIVHAVASKSATGYSTIRVSSGGTLLDLDPQQLTEFTLLPTDWTEETNGYIAKPRAGFARRGPPPNFDRMFTPSDEKRHVFVYSAYQSVWTEKR